MTNIEDVEEYLEYYLDPENKFDFGVMLDGPWGAGKTHFIRSYLEKLHESDRQADPLNEKPFLYVSLYGVSAVSQISEQFFAQTHPILSSGAVRMLGGLIVAAFNAYTGAGVSGADSTRTAIQDAVVRLDGKILVFDDLERCSMPIAEAMGFINAFVEHEGLKVIIVANQEEIPKPQLEDYQRKKEKLIGKTIRIASDPRAVFDVFAGDLQIQAAKKCVLENKEKVLRTFEESGKQNFRSLRSVLADFDRIVSLLGEELQGSDAALSRLLLYIVATGIEFKADALRRDDFARLSPTYFKIRISDAEDGDEKRLDEIQAKYHEVDWSDPVILPEVLVDFFGSGILDRDEVRKHVAEHPLVAGPKLTPAWRQLWAWYDLPRAQYESARSKLIENLETHDLIHPGVILHAAGIVIEFAENGDHILGSRVSIPGFFKKYLRELLIRKTLVPAIEIFDFHRDSYGGLVYRSEKSEAFKVVAEAVREATEKAFSWKMKIKADEWLERMQGGEDMRATLYSHDKEGETYAGASFLQNIEVDRFANLLLSDFCIDRRLMAALKERYSYDSASGKLLAEHDWVLELERTLKRLAAKAPPPQKALLKKRIDFAFGGIRTSLEAVEV